MAQQRVEESKQRRDDLDTVPIALARITNGFVEWANEYFCRTTGYALEEIEGKSTRFLYQTDEEHGKVEELLAEDGQAETRIAMQDGVLLDVSLRVSATGCGSYVLALIDIKGQKQAERILRFTRLGIDNALDAIVWFERNGDIVYANNAASEAVGYTRDELLSMTVFDIGPGMVEKKWNELWHLRKERGGLLIEGQNRHKDGHVFPVEISTKYVRYEDNEYVIATVRDITERKRAEEALREGEQRYRTLFDASPVALMEVDGSAVVGHIASLRASWGTGLKRYVDDHPEVPRECLSLLKVVSVNNAALDLYGNADLEHFRQGVDTFISLAPADMLRDDFLALAEGRREFVSEQTRPTSRGVNVHVHTKWTVVPGYEATYGRMLFCDVDITERKEAEEALRKSEEKYRDIFERATEGIFQSTLEGRFISVSPSYARMLGYETPEELMAKVVDIPRQLYVDPEVRARRMRAIETANGLVRVDTQYYRKDGSTIWVSVNGQPVRDPGGRILYIEGTMEDITERKRAEEEKQKLQAQLRQSQKMEAIGTLAGGVAHDFNNILTVLMGYGALLQTKMEKADPLHMYVDQMLSASQKAASLTQSLLAFSRQQPITLTPSNISDVVKGTERLLRRLLTEDVILKTTLTTEDHTVMADATQIDQILFNLTTNARDAMPKGGTLAIETRLVKLDDQFKKTHGFGEPGRYLLLSVSDTGTGVDEAAKEKIFEPFFTTKATGKGTGLGLATVYGIVKQHNGYILLYSEQNVGTTFHVYLPAMGGIVQESKAPPRRIKSGNETILVAEDDEGVRRLVKDMLTEYGYAVLEAVDGQDAVDQFRNFKETDLVIMDSVMPKKNGRQAYDAIKRMKPEIRVIFMSGYTRDIILDKGISDKRLDFLSKPLQRNELLEKVREVLDR